MDSYNEVDSGEEDYKAAGKYVDENDKQWGSNPLQYYGTDMTDTLMYNSSLSSRTKDGDLMSVYIEQYKEEQMRNKLETFTSPIGIISEDDQSEVEDSESSDDEDNQRLRLMTKQKNKVK